MRTAVSLSLLFFLMDFHGSFASQIVQRALQVRDFSRTISPLVSGSHKEVQYQFQSSKGDSVSKVIKREFPDSVSSGALAPTGPPIRQSYENSNNENQAPIQDSTFFFMSGIGIVAGFFLGTYTITYLSGRLFRNQHPHNFPDENLAPNSGDASNRDEGPIAHKAHMWGILLTERAQVLPIVFSLTTQQWTTEMQKIFRDIAAKARRNNVEKKPHDDSEDSQDRGVEEEVDVDPEVQLGVDGCNEENGGGANDASEIIDDDLLTCSICLTDFEIGESTTTGTTCKHRFHTECFLQWLSRHDHCPYCRQEVMTAKEYRTAAITVLGEERVTSLGMHNQHRHNSNNRTTTISHANHHLVLPF